MAMKINTNTTSRLKDVASLVFFVVAVVVGAWLINMFVFRSFNVDGPSMQNTLHTGERLIVNRLPVTWSKIRSTNYIPERGQIIVFKNPKWKPGSVNEYIVKRVIAFPGERVVVSNGKLTVYNDTHPGGLDVDKDYQSIRQPTSGQTDVIVPHGELFVAGDNREEGYSYDSRNSLGTIPFENVIGPVAIRMFPFNKIVIF